MTARTDRAFSAAVIIFYPLFIILALSSVFEVPFSPETVTRFLVPFEFHGAANPSWAVMESARWEIFRPVYSLSVLVDYELWGTDARMYHATDLILSWLCYSVCFLLLKRRFGLLTASVAVLLWAVHPAQPLSIYKILGRNDRLVTLFTVTALFLYDLYLHRNTGRILSYTLILCSVILAGLSKDTGLFYSILLPLWSILAAERTVRETVRSDLPLWIGIGALAGLFFLLRAIAGFGASADAPALATGMDYIAGLSRLIRMSLPLPGSLHIPPLVTCSVAAAATAAFICFRKLPGALRFGAAGAAVFIFPFPFFWVQYTFMWGFTLWASLGAASILVLVFRKNFGSGGAAGRVISTVLLFLLLGISGIWSSGALAEQSERLIMYGRITEQVSSGLQGHSYPVADIRAGFPEWAAEMDASPENVRQKVLVYITELVQVATGDPEAFLE